MFRILLFKAWDCGFGTSLYSNEKLLRSPAKYVSMRITF